MSATAIIPVLAIFMGQRWASDRVAEAFQPIKDWLDALESEPSAAEIQDHAAQLAKIAPFAKRVNSYSLHRSLELLVQAFTIWKLDRLGRAEELPLGSIMAFQNVVEAAEKVGRAITRL